LNKILDTRIPPSWKPTFLELHGRIGEGNPSLFLLGRRKGSGFMAPKEALFNYRVISFFNFLNQSMTREYSDEI
jgi:hypothetical protein